MNRRADIGRGIDLPQHDDQLRADIMPGDHLPQMNAVGNDRVDRKSDGHAGKLQTVQIQKFFLAGEHKVTNDRRYQQKPCKIRNDEQ